MKCRKPKGNALILDCKRRSWVRPWRSVGYYKNRWHYFRQHRSFMHEMGFCEGFRFVTSSDAT